MTARTELTLPRDQPELILTRDFAAPRALVYKCWMEPSHLARWWGPKPFTCPVCEVEPRVGGAFHLVIRSPDGQDYPMVGRFLEIAPNERIVKTDDVSQHSADWHRTIDPAWQPGHKFNITTTIAFAGEAAGTRVTLTVRCDTIGIRDAFVRVGMKEAWSSSFERLDEMLDAIKDAPNEMHFRRLIAAPREKVFAAFSDPKGLAQWWGPNGFTTTTEVMDFRVGGEWIQTMHGPDGTDYPNYLHFTRIEAPRLIAWEHGSRKGETPLFSGSIRLEAQEEKTLVTLSLAVKSGNERDQLMSRGAVEGGTQNLARLEAYLARAL